MVVSMLVFGLGWCVGGLVNEWYRRRHPYVPLYQITYVAKSPDIANVNASTNRPVWQTDPSPRPRPE